MIERRRSVAGGWPIDLIVLALLLAPAWLPLLQGQMLGSDDGYDHLYRLIERVDSLRRGDPYARWSDNYALGFGYPVFHYYGPATTFLGVPFVLLGATLIAAINACLITGLAAGATGMYALLRGNVTRPAAVIGALAYAASPYFLIDLFLRSAVAESLALGIAPWLFLAVARATRAGPSRSTVSIALATGALILMHNITALFVLPLAGGWALSRAGLDFRRVGDVAAAMVAGAGLTAVYWYPAIADRGLVHLERLTTQYFDFHNHFNAGIDVVQRTLTFEYRFDFAQRFFFRAGLVQIGMAGLGWIVALARRGRRLDAMFWATVLAVATLLQSDAAAPIWESVPPLAFAQFPFRLLVLTSLASAMLVGYLADALPAGIWRRFGVVALGAVWLVASFSGLRPILLDLAPGEASEYALRRIEIDRSKIGTSTGGEFMPKSAPSDLFAVLDRAPTFSARPIPIVGATSNSLGAISLRLADADGGQVSIDRHAFPLWSARTDGRALAIGADEQRGFIRVDVPPGVNSVIIEGATPASVVVGTAAALASAIIVILAMPMRLVVRFGLALTLALIGWVGFVPRPPPELPGLAIGTFDSGQRLVGWHADGSNIEFFWTTDRPLRGDLRAALRAIDADGNVVARHDWLIGGGARPGGMWTPGLLVRDRVALPAAAEDGAADLRWAIGVTRERGYGAPLSGRTITWTDRCPCVAQTPDGRGIDLGNASLDRARTERSVGSADVTPRRPNDSVRASLGIAAGTVSLEGSDVEIGDVLANSYGPRDWIDQRMARLARRLGVVAPAAEVGHVGGPAKVLATVPPGGDLSLRLRWVALAEPIYDYAVTVQVLDRQGRLLAQDDEWPRRGFSPTGLWSRGFRVDDRFRLRLPSDTPSGVHRVVVGLYRRSDLRRVNWTGERARGDWAELGAIKVPPVGIPTFGSGPSAEFGPVSLVGLTAAPPVSARVGEPFAIEPVWQVNGTLDRDYTTFVHLSREGLPPVANGDSPPLSGSYPTSAWESGETIRDRYTVVAPGDLGVFDLSIGFYDPQSGRRLVASDGRDAISLGRISIVP
ncbi:MAG: hypothetical protein EPO26_10000 [Chloroflexota bacterium]|nr:MAG: hypothetical protein EPO26_10000 [Chloroflexota bacterium]